ncbi:hypothetical protein M406DRAFT_231052, partial [Cryphonectria parasitica EP155]
RELLGPTPPVADVCSIIDEAAEYAVLIAEEAMWNSAVHYPLMQLALYGERRQRSTWRQPQCPREGGLPAVSIRVAQCTTARITREYLPAVETSGKQVDFCFYMQIDAATQQRIDAMHASLPLRSINHTGLEGLLGRPIALSCESKK